MKQTEIGMLPEDWEVKFIKDVSNIFVGGDVDFSKFSDVQDLKYQYPVFSNTVSNRGLYGYSSSYKVDANSVTVIGRGIGIGKSFSRKGKYTAIGRLIVLDLSSNLLNNVFLSNYINSYLEIYDESGGIPQLTGISLGRYQIPLPPLPEQEAIAEALSDADAWIESLEQLIAKKRLIKQGAMQELLTPKENWEVKKLGEVSDFRRGSFPQPYGLDKWYDNTNGMPFIQVFDVAKNRKLKLDTKSKISALAQPMSVFVPKGTIVLTIQGSIGRIALTQYDAYCDRTLLIFQRINTDLDKFFFLLQVEQVFEMEKEKAPGGTIKTITKEALSDFDITFPKSLTEQTRIATILSDMDLELEALEAQLAKARKIKQGMMQELLTGRVRLV